ncbi:GTPase [Spirochaetia bacterium]|nr:GTPase [Spirochaetia bacterium]
MINAQKKVIEFCDLVFENAKTANVEDIQQKVTSLKEMAQNQELIVPVVGAFSAGKSTLINKIIGSDILPVAITPETSLATELHYAVEEYIEAIKNDGTIKRYTVNEITIVKDKAADYKFARLFLNSDIIKELEPLILVDMPGFDSPLDQHNKAINEYLGRGCHYIVLSDVEDGTVSKSVLRRIKFIDEIGGSFSFFLTKVNLRSQADVEKITKECHAVIDRNIELDVPILSIGNESGEAVVQVLKSIDIDKLFFRLFKEPLKEHCYALIDALNTRIRAAKATLDSNKALIKEMEESVLKIQRKADDMILNVQARYSGGFVTSVVNKDIGRALDSSLDELVNMAVKGDSDSTSRRLNEIIQMTLATSVKSKLGDIGNQIASDFALEVSGIDRIMKDCAIDENYAQNMTVSVQTTFSTLQTLADKWTDPDNSKTRAGATGLAAVATIFLGPVGDIIAVLLPMVIIPLIANFQKQKQIETLRNKFLTEIFPGIKLRLQSDIQANLDEHIKIMIEQIRDQYEEKINAQKAEVANAIELKKTAANEIQQEITELNNIRNNVQALTNKIMDE